GRRRSGRARSHQEGQERSGGRGRRRSPGSQGGENRETGEDREGGEGGEERKEVSTIGMDCESCFFHQSRVTSHESRVGCWRRFVISRSDGPMRLIVGLGNPDPEYQWTPHNLGFMVVDELANRNGIRVERPEGRALVG